jgi:hypothetical protein
MCSYLYGSPVSYTVIRSRGRNLCVAYRPMATLRCLIKKYGDVNFNQLKGFNKPGWENETVLNEERKTMASAALLHFNGENYCEMIMNLDMKALSSFEMSMGVNFDDV